MRKNLTKNLKQIFSLTLIILLSVKFHAQTSIPTGSVSGNWTIAGSPYLIQGHIMVPIDSTLIIDPGVVVSFQGHYKLEVQGDIQAVGALNDTITFTAADTINGWWGIRFGSTPSNQDSSRIVYCKLKFGNANGTGDNSYGGALYFKNVDKVRISNCLINKNTASLGAGIFCYASSPMILNNSIIKNTCTGSGGGGIFCHSSASQITNNIITKNNCPNGGGGGVYTQYARPQLLIKNNIISFNQSNINGAGICSRDYAIAPLPPPGTHPASTLTINSNTITNNICIGSGGGLYINNSLDPGGVISNNQITNNSANNGAAIYCITSDPLIDNNNIKYNSSSSYGGGISCVQSNPTITGNSIDNNSALYGAGISSTYLGTPIVKTNTVSYNSANYDGGGIYTDTGLQLDRNYICNNHSNNGAGIFCTGMALNRVFSNNVICNNTAELRGGGIYYNNSGSSTNSRIVNCSISNNKVNFTGLSYGGGGLFCTNNSNPTIYNSIIYNNEALSTNGNQVYLEDDSSDPVFKNSNIQGTSSSFYTNGNVYTGTYVDNINTNPGYISPSSGNGQSFNGLVANWGIPAISPCVNGGYPFSNGQNPSLLDITGITRIIGDTIDIGAFEFNLCPYITIDTSVTQNGIKLTANSTGTYQWLDCNNSYNLIPGATSKTYTPTSNGSYCVRIKKSGCLDTSSCHSITSVSIIENNLNNDISIYPNPTSDLLNISLENNIDLFSVRLFDIKNQTILEKNDLSGSKHSINISELSNGIYFLELKSQERTAKIKFIKSE